MFDEEHSGEGGITLISAMETRHLLYTIRLRVRLLHDMFVVHRDEISSRKQKLYGFDQLDEGAQIQLIKTKMRQTYVYCTEAFFRVPEIIQHKGLMDILLESVAMLQDLLERDGRLMLPTNVLQLPPGVSAEEFLDTGLDTEILDPDDDMPF